MWLSSVGISHQSDTCSADDWCKYWSWQEEGAELSPARERFKCKLNKFVSGVGWAKKVWTLIGHVTIFSQNSFAFALFFILCKMFFFLHKGTNLIFLLIVYNQTVNLFILLHSLEPTTPSFILNGTLFFSGTFHFFLRRTTALIALRLTTARLTSPLAQLESFELVRPRSNKSNWSARVWYQKVHPITPRVFPPPYKHLLSAPQRIDTISPNNIGKLPSAVPDSSERTLKMKKKLLEILTNKAARHQGIWCDMFYRHRFHVFMA